MINAVKDCLLLPGNDDEGGVFVSLPGQTDVHLDTNEAQLARSK
jgi:hypothetical protein